MSTFNLTNTASQVDTAIQAVVGADTTPTNGSANMVTSDGVFDYVGTQLGDLAGKTVTVESTGIAATDNDTSIPTSAAVNAAVTASGVKVASYTKASGSTAADTVIPVTEALDSSNIGSVSSGTVTLGAGTYLVAFSGSFAEEDGSAADYYTISLRHNGSAIASSIVNETGSLTQYVSVSHTTVITSGSSQTVDIFADEEPATSVNYQNVSLSILKIG